MTDTQKAFDDYHRALTGRPLYPTPSPPKPRSNPMSQLLYLLFSIATAMVGYQIHGSLFWAIVDFFFVPLAIIKWLVCHELTWSVIQKTFSFLAT